MFRSVDTALAVHTWLYRYLPCSRTRIVCSSFRTSLIGEGVIPSPPMRKSKYRSISSPLPPSLGQEKGEYCCGGHPHIPRQGRPCNPFLASADKKCSAAVVSDRCEIMSMGSRYL